MTRLSEKQRGFLLDIAASETPTYNHPQGLPLYLSYCHMRFDFNTEGQRERWYLNLEKRGLITRTGNSKCFARLTEKGRQALDSR